MTETRTARPASVPADWAVVDCDIHNTVPSAEALFPYLSDYWREYITQSAFKGPGDTAYPPGYPTTARADAKPASGEAGSDPDFLISQTLDAWDAEVGILNCSYAIESIKNPYAAEALARATNDWQIEHWLAREPRLRASIVVASQQPDMAAAEIDRVGDHPGFVQVFLPIRSSLPYGNRQFHPIYEAAARHDLVVGFHFGGSPGVPPTAAGWPSYYAEEYAGMAHIFQSQLMSLVVEGVFDKFGSLRVALLEGGWTWLPAFLWRFDKEWKGLRREIPWSRQLPSVYVREHVKLSLQPLHAPHDNTFLLETIDALDSDELLMFSTDYPHWHFDDPAEAVPAGLPESIGRKIMADNARAFYRLPR